MGIKLGLGDIRALLASSTSTSLVRQWDEAAGTSNAPVTLHLGCSDRHGGHVSENHYQKIGAQQLQVYSHKYQTKYLKNS